MSPCWLCGKQDTGVIDYSLIETPSVPAFPAHARCVDPFGESVRPTTAVT